MENLAEDVAERLKNAIEQRGKATLAVPGGTTPSPFLKLLSEADIAWNKVKVMLTDERFVPQTSERSNTRLLRETLLRNNAAAATLLPFYKNADKPEDVLAELTACLEKALPIDVCVLGMGADMHTASLFPEADLLDEALDENTPHIILPMRAPGAPEPRITLTAPVLRGAGAIFILITGPQKKAALEQALLNGPTSEAPIRCILDASTPVDIYYAE